MNSERYLVCCEETTIIPEIGHLEAQWTRLGVLLNCEPACDEPDLERVLLATTSGLRSNSRLLPLVVTWLVQYGDFVAKHRLKALAAELEPVDQATLGLLLECALVHNAAPDLRLAAAACRALTTPQPLFDVHRSAAALAAIAHRTAIPLSRRWGLWCPEVELKSDAVRPVDWLLHWNPSYRSRIIRKGDLRCSILEALRHDVAGQANSEAAVAHLSGATRAAVRKALAALVLEGEVVVTKRPGNLRDKSVTLRRVA